MIYENGALSKILTDEGYITLSGTAPTYHYYLKDHLGNNRVVLNQNGTTVEQMNHYYPFGGLFDQTSETLQAYKYNGKELDRTYGIDLYDYSARFMDGTVGRFTTMDPLSEKYYSVSPYGYVMNNPMRFVDPDGRASGDFFKKKLTILIYPNSVIVMKMNNQLNCCFLCIVAFLLLACRNDVRPKDTNLNRQNTNQTDLSEESRTKMYVINNDLISKDFAYLSKYEPKEGFVPTAEIAYKIADVILSNIFGKVNMDKQKPFSINLDNGIWIIDGYLEPEMKGGLLIWK